MQRTLWFADAILVASVVSACSAPRDASANIVDSTGGRAVDDNGARPVAFIADLENPESVR